ncbi:hypothetical protein [Celeribacter sp.]|uniref:dioxygenase family protein n=1 Tax=Celeribacter sp. TaxID=1890673 RepID=UPI003A94C852
MPHQDDHADHGFRHDFPHLLGRRRFLTVLSGLGLSATAGLPATALDCVAIPRETAGPFPADGTNRRAGQIVDVLTQNGVLRRDITSSFGEAKGQAEGVPISLELTLQDHAGCTPLEGYAIYIWHCDAGGAYSMYNVPEANWLRGLAVADASGKVAFDTVVPGCYPRRWPHIHFEVFESAEAAVSGVRPVLISQLAFSEGQIDEIYQSDQGRYAQSIRNLAGIPLSRDSIFRDNSAAELAQQTVEVSSGAGSLAGHVTIPIAL